MTDIFRKFVSRRGFFKRVFFLSFLFSGFSSLAGRLFPKDNGGGISGGGASKVFIKINDKFFTSVGPRLRREASETDYGEIKKCLDEGIIALSGAKSSKDGWSYFFKRGDVVGIKVNSLAGYELSPRWDIIKGIAEGLISAGVEKENIIVWDRLLSELEKAGYVKKAGEMGIRCAGTDDRRFGYSDTPETAGAVGTLFSRILSSHITALINVPILKDHDLSGVSISMKNLFGAIHNPNKYHDSNCNPYVADLSTHSFIKDKQRLIVCDALNVLYNGGPGYKPQWTQRYNGIMMSTDPVAVDKIGYDIIEEIRREKGLPTLKEAEREPKYIFTAADYRLGSLNPEIIRA